MTAHETIGFEVEEKVRLRGAAPAVDASRPPVSLLTDQLAAMSPKHQEAQAAATCNAECARLAEWDAGQLRGQIGLATTLPQLWPRPTRKWRTWAIGSNQQATNLADLSARLQQQLDSSRANDEAQIATLLSLSGAAHHHRP